MTRDPFALHVGQRVITPNGEATTRARRCSAGIWTYLALDWWWRETQLTVPEPPTQPLISPRCRNDRHKQSSDGCGGGFLHNDHVVGCACTCHAGPQRRDELEAC